jgi:hypothetical protein
MLCDDKGKGNWRRQRRELQADACWRHKNFGLQEEVDRADWRAWRKEEVEIGGAEIVAWRI